MKNEAREKILKTIDAMCDQLLVLYDGDHSLGPLELNQISTTAHGIRELGSIIDVSREIVVVD